MHHIQLGAVLTPCGQVPHNQLEKACELLAITPDDAYNPSLLGWSIRSDTLQDLEKYKDAIGSKDPRGGWDIHLIDQFPATVLRHEIESRVYRAYCNRYKNCHEAFASYSRNQHPEIRENIIITLHRQNTQTQQTNLSDKERKTQSEKKRFEQKLHYLNS